MIFFKQNDMLLMQAPGLLESSAVNFSWGGRRLETKAPGKWAPRPGWELALKLLTETTCHQSGTISGGFGVQFSVGFVLRGCAQGARLLKGTSPS